MSVRILFKISVILNHAISYINGRIDPLQMQLDVCRVGLEGPGNR